MKKYSIKICRALSRDQYAAQKRSPEKTIGSFEELEVQVALAMRYGSKLRSQSKCNKYYVMKT